MVVDGPGGDELTMQSLNLEVSRIMAWSGLKRCETRILEVALTEEGRTPSTQICSDMSTGLDALSTASHSLFYDFRAPSLYLH